MDHAYSYVGCAETGSAGRPLKDLVMWTTEAMSIAHQDCDTLPLSGNLGLVKLRHPGRHPRVSPLEPLSSCFHI